MAILTTTIAVDGIEDIPVEVAVQDDHRKYITLYARTGSCKVSLGDVDHETGSLIIAQGNQLDLERINGSRVLFSKEDTNDALLHVTTGIGDNTVLTSDDKVLTYNGTVLYHNPRLTLRNR